MQRAEKGNAKDKSQKGCHQRTRNKGQCSVLLRTLGIAPLRRGEELEESEVLECFVCVSDEGVNHAPHTIGIINAAANNRILYNLSFIAICYCNIATPS